VFLVFIVHNSQRLCQYYYTLQKKETHKGILGILNQNCSVTLLDIDSNHQRQPLTQTLDQLRQMLQQEWRTILRNNVRNLIGSMPRRCRAVLSARGGHTRY
jgi:hypothetical protein